MGMAMQVGEELFTRGEKRPAEYGIENALAAKVRREYPANTINNVAAIWRLTNGEARGIVYARTGLKSINKVVRKGGWKLWLWLGNHLFDETFDQFIQREREQLHVERQRAAEHDRRLLRLVSDLRAGDHLDTL